MKWGENLMIFYLFNANLLPFIFNLKKYYGTAETTKNDSG